MSKSFIIITTLAVLALVGIFVVLNPDQPSQTSQNQPPEEVLAIQPDDHVAGNAEAAVVLVEYGDFQCPACAAAHPLVSQLKAELGDQVAIVWRHFPLTAIHPNALSAARATEAAGRQGKFWEMHDILFERQDEWSNASGAKSLFEDYARELGLNPEQFTNDTNDPATSERVERDLDSAQQLAVRSTPTFFLNGQLIQNPANYQQLKSQVEAALAKNNNQAE